MSMHMRSPIIVEIMLEAQMRSMTDSKNKKKSLFKYTHNKRKNGEYNKYSVNMDNTDK